MAHGLQSADSWTPGSRNKQLIQPIPFLVIYPRERKICMSTQRLTQKFHRSFILNSSKLETTAMSMNRRLDKTVTVYHTMEYYLAIKRTTQSRQQHGWISRKHCEQKKSCWGKKVYIIAFTWSLRAGNSSMVEEISSGCGVRGQKREEYKGAFCGNGNALNLDRVHLTPEWVVKKASNCNS